MHGHPTRQGSASPENRVTSRAEIVILGAMMGAPGAASTAPELGPIPVREEPDVNDDTSSLFPEMLRGERTCIRCQESKPVAEFSPNTHRKDGLQPYCRPCGTGYTRRWRGVSDEQSDLRPAPNERCAICGGVGGKRGLCLDHDHADGHVRGWLCHGCNSAIGHFHDDPRLLERAIRYLKMDEAG